MKIENIKKAMKTIKDIIDKNDPIGLINIGAPSDEYDSETKQISNGLDKCNSEEDVLNMVYKIFKDSFDEDIAGKKDTFKNIAKQIYENIK